MKAGFVTENWSIRSLEIGGGRTAWAKSLWAGLWGILRWNSGAVARGVGAYSNSGQCITLGDRQVSGPFRGRQLGKQ